MRCELDRVERHGRMRGPGRDISVALVVKLLALALIYILFFSPSDRPRIDAARVRAALTAPMPASSSSIPDSPEVNP